MYMGMEQEWRALEKRTLHDTRLLLDAVRVLCLKMFKVVYDGYTAIFARGT